MEFECKTCDVIEACKATFGKYWADKSGGGIGCEYKYPAETGRTVQQKKPAPAKRIVAQKKFWCEEVEA